MRTRDHVDVAEGVCKALVMHSAGVGPRRGLYPLGFLIAMVTHPWTSLRVDLTTTHWTDIADALMAPGMEEVR